MAQSIELPKSENLALSIEEFQSINLDLDESKKIRKAIPQIKREEKVLKHILQLRPADHIKFYDTFENSKHAIVEDVFEKRNEVSVIEFITKQHRTFQTIIAKRKIYKFSEMKFVNLYVYDDQLDIKTTLENARSFLGNTDYSHCFEEVSQFGTWCKTGQITSQQSSRSPVVWSLAAAGLAKLVERFSISLLSELVEKVSSNVIGAGVGGLVKITLAIKDLFELIKDLKNENCERSVFQEKLFILISRHTFGVIAFIFAAMLTTPVSIPGYILSIIFIVVSSSLGEYGGDAFGKVVVSVRRQWSDVLSFFNEKLKNAKAKVIEMYKECKDAIYNFIIWFFSNAED